MFGSRRLTVFTPLTHSFIHSFVHLFAHSYIRSLIHPLTLTRYPTHFGQMECLKLIASNKFSEKRVGYLGLTQLLDEDTEVLMLVTNSIKNDLHSSNQYINGLALGALGNIANSEMCRNLAHEVEKIMCVSNPYTKKKAALCAIRIARMCPDIRDKFTHCVGSYLTDTNHGVVLAGCGFISAMIAADPAHVETFRHFLPQLGQRIRSVVQSGYASAAEYEVGGVTDPFLQTRLLQLIRELSVGLEEVPTAISDRLAQVAANTESTRNVGNAILYECVKTIMDVGSDPGLRVLGVNILGRFLQNRDNNIRYVALTMLKHAVGVEAKAVHRHRQMIVECLKDSDISIRRRALDVTFALISSENVKTMTRELLNFVLEADDDFRADIITKVCHAVERYSPNGRWLMDCLIRGMTLAGTFYSSDVRDTLINALILNPELQAYAVHKLFFSCKENRYPEMLTATTLWCVGEFGDLLIFGEAQGPDGQRIAVSVDEIMSLLEDVEAHLGTIMAPDRSGDHIAELLLTAVAKLASKVEEAQPRAAAMLKRFSTSRSMELQQRACEYGCLLTPALSDLLEGVLDRMPAVDRAKSQQQHGARPVDVSVNEIIPPDSGGSGGGGVVSTSLLDLDADLDVSSQSQSSSAVRQQPTAAPAAAGAAIGTGLLGDSSSSSSATFPSFPATGQSHEGQPSAGGAAAAVWGGAAPAEQQQQSAAAAAAAKGSGTAATEDLLSELFG
eukprot:GHVU01178706.1.p1 GENE.GHVU01178706.1~~GHVU01178706.1.p1  ORF type:complete len:730 (-),score=159.31 GHVU01178706.1:586-2775(-)